MRTILINGYDQNSTIGKAGLERVWEDRLKGEDGYEIYILDSTGAKKETIIEKEVKHGETITTTIDATLQQELYNSMEGNKGFYVSINPKTGEILALVSTPAYDSNDFVMGYSNAKWDSVVSDERNLLLNRFTSSWTPGSTFKPITGGIALTTGAITADETLETSGLQWQKDESWGDYYVTTLTPYSDGANMKNALMRSDNIYFAKVALRIGAARFVENLNKMGFAEELPFEIGLTKSQVSNSGSIDTEVMLADSGYGQGQILVNPIHFASLYSMFVNEGNMIEPYIEYQEDAEPTIWKQNVISAEAASIIKEDLIAVVEDPRGTAHDAQIAEVTLAGKTGTAEIQKNSVEEEGSQLGWFSCFTCNTSDENAKLIIGMVEDAETIGGSHYIISKIVEIWGRSLNFK